jgi:protein disulfide-isomerase A1
MLPLAKKYEEYLQFTTIDVTEYPEMLPMYGQQPSSSKVLSVHHPSNGQIYPHKRMEKASAAVVEQFLRDIIDGKVKPWSGYMSSEGNLGHEEL